MRSTLGAAVASPGAARRPPLVTADPGCASAALSRVFCPVEVDPLGPVDEFSLALSVVDLGPLTLGHVSYGSDISLDAGEDRGCYVVTIPLSGQVAARSGGQQILATRERATVFGPIRDAGFEHWPAGCPQLALRIDQQALEQWLQERLAIPVVSPVQFHFGLNLTSPAARGWLSAIQILATELEQPGGLAAQPVLATEVQHLIIAGLLMCQPHNYSDALRGPGPLPQPKAVRVATDLIKNQPGHPWSIPQLAAAAGVSVRALEYGFRRYIGVTPRTYLRDCRLQCAHEELRRSSPAEATVTEVAYRWGFTHLGRFAQAYRRKYALTPSMTLRQADDGAQHASPQA
jgi:AraC-like DNA-binding protein